MASALSMLLDRRASKTEVGRSIQKPVVSRSHGGVGKSTASNMVLCLSSMVGQYLKFLEDAATDLTLKNPNAGHV